MGACPSGREVVHWTSYESGAKSASEVGSLRTACAELAVRSSTAATRALVVRILMIVLGSFVFVSER
jgi:hypothetical protein